METLTSNDKVKINEYKEGGISLLQQMADLKESLSDMTKALAGELDVKPAVLMKMLRVAFKNNLEEEREKLAEVEVLLETSTS